MKKVILLTLIAVSITTVKAQSAWTLDEGAVYTQLNFMNIGPYNRLVLDGNQTVMLPGTITDRTYQAYVEYGLT